MLNKSKKISSIKKAGNPWWEYNIDIYEYPNGKKGEYHYVNSRGSTFIIPLTDTGNFIMVKQYRYLNDRESLEFPGGGQKEGISPEINARQELLEESGFEPGKMTLLGEFNPFNGVTNEICRVYLAENLIKRIPMPDESEEFEIIEINKKDIICKIIKGELWDGMSLAAWSIYCFSQKEI